MAGWNDVRRLALALPETTEIESRGSLQWRVKNKLFVWERPLRKTDLAALGDRAPDGPILGARVADLGEKEAWISEDPAVFFTIPHFDGYSAVLIRLERIDMPRLETVVAEAWVTRAPARLAAAHLQNA